MKRSLIFFFTVFVLSPIIFWLVLIYNESRLLRIKSVREIESRLGEPYGIYDQFPPVFGKSIVTENELLTEFEIRVYLVRSFGQKYLVVKARKKPHLKDNVIVSQFEYS
jgi:hypothetical protein